MAKKTKPVPRERVLVIVLALVIGLPPAIWLAWPRGMRLDDPAAGYQAVCPPAAGQPLVILTYDSRRYSPEDGASYTDFQDRLVVFDPADGSVLHRELIGERREGMPADCFAAHGDHVWLWTQTDGFHVREARTGRVVRSQDQLLGPVSPESVNAAHYDATARRLFLSTKDGRTHALDASFSRTVVAARSRDAQRSVRAGPAAMRENRSLLARIDGVATSRGPLSTEGESRRAILVGGEPLAGTDWLSPQLVVDPSSRSVEWAGPPSLIVCEPHEVGKPPQIVTRATLAGEILWTYVRPPEHSTSGNDCMWYATSDGKRLVMFTAPNGMVGIDTASGNEVFRRTL